MVLGSLALLAILATGALAWRTVLRPASEPADEQPEVFVPEAVDDVGDRPAQAPTEPGGEATAPPAEQPAQVEDTSELDEPTPPAAEDDPPDASDEPAEAPADDPQPTAGRVQPVPWLSLIPPAGSGWSFEVFAEAGLPAFEGTQAPQGYLEVFVDDGFTDLGEAARQVELDAATFGATEIGRDRLPVPGADAALALLHSVPDEAAPFDQGILLLEVANDAQPLIVVMVMLSEGAGPTLFEIEETFASVALDPDALRAATAG